MILNDIAINRWVMSFKRDRYLFDIDAETIILG